MKDCEIVRKPRELRFDDSRGSESSIARRKWLQHSITPRQYPCTESGVRYDVFSCCMLLPTYGTLTLLSPI
ncbi:hypothetical protein J6590_076815 [Homalodisca vitripennis]|nr:hypothetical protein J6590_076815 [Homalodisca vitripennis]